MAVEFRNPRWYTAWGFVKRELMRLGLAHVSVDAPPHPEAPPRVLEPTWEVAVLRCHGRNAETWKGPHQKPYERFNWRYSEEELLDLAEATRTLAAQAERVFVIFNNNYGTQGWRPPWDSSAFWVLGSLPGPKGHFLRPSPGHLSPGPPPRLLLGMELGLLSERGGLSRENDPFIWDPIKESLEGACKRLLALYDRVLLLMTRPPSAPTWPWRKPFGSGTRAASSSTPPPSSAQAFRPCTSGPRSSSAGRTRRTCSPSYGGWNGKAAYTWPPPTPRP